MAYEQLAELQAKQDAFASILTQHDRDIELLEAGVEALQKKHDLQARTGGTMPARRMRRRKPGTVQDLSSTLWRAISHLEIHLDDTAKAEQVDISELCKLSHALSQSAATYLKALEVGELEQRLEALERAQAATQANPYRRVA